MSTTFPQEHPERRRGLARVLVAGAALAILATAAAVFAVASEDDGPARAPTVTNERVSASPQTDPLIIRYGHRAPDPHNDPRVGGTPESGAELLDDPLVIRYGQR